jgi:site-specific recombinase XerD
MVSSGHSAGSIALRLHYLRRLQLAVNPLQASGDDLSAFLAHPGWSPETRKSARASVRSFYRWAVDTDRLTVDPSRKLPAVHVPAGKPKPAPESILVAALARADVQGRRMIVLAAFAGLRRTEIAQVHTDHIVEGCLRVVGKGGRTRLIPLSSPVVHMLAGCEGWVFPGRFGGHMTPGRIGVVLKTLLGDGYSGHTLRHRFATQAYAAQRDLRAVQELLGHSKLETTQRYVQIADDALLAAVLGASLVA